MGPGTLQEALARKDFPDVARHLAQGGDVNIRIGRGRGVPGALEEWGLWPGIDPNFAGPLHACAAMHGVPGAYETALLFISRGADLNAGDAEGDTPLAHARYFRASSELFRLYEGRGAKVSGPFYGRVEAR